MWGRADLRHSLSREKLASLHKYKKEINLRERNAHSLLGLTYSQNNSTTKLSANSGKHFEESIFVN